MNVLVTGGAGFIGSHLIDYLIDEGHNIVCIDDVSLGNTKNIAHLSNNQNFKFIEMNILNKNKLNDIFLKYNFDHIFHLAANSDIQEGSNNRTVDLKKTFLTTFFILEAMANNDVKSLVFSSTSAIYGEIDKPLYEDIGPLFPISFYGAAKLASEAYISAYCEKFNIKALICRFPNVVGGRLTHGAIFDFIEKLTKNPKELIILGDGKQNKSYLYIDDLIEGIIFCWKNSNKKINYFNLGVDGTTNVTKIAEIVVEEMGLNDVEFKYTGGDRGWSGDVPNFSYDLSKVNNLGWKANISSDEAIRLAVRSELKNRSKNMKAVILAGGKGTRLGNLTKDIPKPMVKIGGKPILEHQINLLKKYGINEIIILCCHLSESIKDYFKDGNSFGIKITYVCEKEPLGTAGSLKEIEDELTEDFLVIYGDVMLDVNLNKFIEYHLEKNSDCTLAIHPNDHPNDSDLVEIDGDSKVIAFHSKPHEENKIFRNLVNASLYIMSPKILRYIEKGISSDFGKDIFPKIVDIEKVYGYNTSEYLKDMGTPKRFEQVNKDYLTKKIQRMNYENKRKAIFLDRDGVINYNETGSYICKIDEFKLLPNVIEAIKEINKSEYLAIIITNQPVVARNLCTIEDVENIHKKMETLLGKENTKLDGIYYCPHHPDKGYPEENPLYKIECSCRKPKTGMVEKAVKDFNIDLKGSFFIGDSFRDIMCGKNAGMTTIGVETGVGCKDKEVSPDHFFKDLFEAVKFITSQNN